MADSSVTITSGTGTSIDTRTESTNGNHRQVIIIGDPATNAGVAPVDATAGLKVDLGADNDITGTVTANAGTNLNTSALALEAGGNLASIKAKTDNIPALGQALAAASVPVVLTAAQITTLTPPTPQTDALTDTQLRATPVPVSGTVAVTNAGITTIAGAVSGTEMQVDVLTMPSVAVTNAGTFAVQVDGSALTSLQLIDDSVYTDGSGTVTKGIAILGQDGTNPQAIKTDASGELQVDVLTMPTVAVTQSGTWDEVGINDSGNSITVDGNLGADLRIGSAAVTTSNPVPVMPPLSGYLNVSIDQTGNNNAVDVLTLPSIPAGTNAIGKLAANSGVDIGDVTLTAGTAAIGTLLPPDIDVTAHTNYARKYYTNAGAVTDGIVWSPAAGKRWHVITMYIQTSAAATITLEDDKAGGDDPVWKGEIAANSGVTLSFSEKYPMASGEDAADLLVTTSAGNVYITCVGYEV